MLLKEGKRGKVGERRGQEGRGRDEREEEGRGGKGVLSLPGSESFHSPCCGDSSFVVCAARTCCVNFGDATTAAVSTAL